MTGKIAKTDKITTGDDVKDAKALAANAGYTAVEVTPVLEGGRPVAEIAPMKGGQFKRCLSRSGEFGWPRGFGSVRGGSGSPGPGSGGACGRGGIGGGLGVGSYGAGIVMSIR